MNYQPVSCDLVDQIEIFATNRQTVRVVVGDESHSFLLKSKIKTWYTKDKVEYLVFQGNVKIRLDKIIQIGDFLAADSYCSL